MNSKREKCNQQQEYIRMFTSIQQSYVYFKSCKIASEHQIANEQMVEIKCQYFKNQQIDLFSIRLNTIVCILQKHCGFRVRSFILQEKDTKKKAIYMFLSLSQGNLVKAAQAYCIKKEVYPSYIDFYINDPSNSDGRPLKFHSEFQIQKSQIKYNKLIGRFFKEPFDFTKTSSIIQEKDTSHNLLSNFASFNESAFQLLEDIKKAQLSIKLSNRQKQLIYNYTKKKNMKACYGIFTHHKKRQIYYYLLAKLISFHGFKVHKTLRTFKKFFLPYKQSIGSSFKSKVQALISFVPQVVNSQGQLDFFSRMQKTKMCYQKLKNAFKLDFLSKLNYEFFTLSNDYQKFGAAPQGDRYSFTNVVDSQLFHSYFTDIYPIRNYFGNNISFQILTVVSMVQYLTSISMLYLFIFLIQQFNVFTQISIQYIASTLFIAGFQILSTYWKEQQAEFINRYSDQKDSQIFLREYKGPYLRNPLNDELNEFINTDHSTNFFGNVIATVAISSILAIIGLFFFVVRLLLLQLFGYLGQYQYSMFSISHIIAYCLYFIALMIFQQFFGGVIISRLVKFLNPSTEYHQRKLAKSIAFLFLLGIQFIGPLFFLVIEPLNKTSCLADSCLGELQSYVSSRYIFITAFNLLQLVYSIY